MHCVQFMLNDSSVRMDMMSESLPGVLGCYCRCWSPTVYAAHLLSVSTGNSVEIQA